MKINFLIVSFVIFFSNQFVNSKEIKILAWVNNEVITTADIENQVTIKRNVLNKVIYNINVKKELFKLIDKKIKLLEIERKKININPKIIKKNYNSFLRRDNINANFSKKNQHIEDIIKEEIKIELAWKKLIRQVYGWKINVNIYEIKNKEKKIDENLDTNAKNKIKNRIFISEKNKKFEIFSNQHLAKIQKKTFIKINE